VPPDRTVWLRVAEAARRLRLPRKQVRTLVASGVIPGVKCGPARNSPWRVTERAVDDYQARRAS
jgi:excisionase family DNA binding protein